MADRTCARCGKQFRYPSDLRRHRERKTPCAPVVPDPNTDEEDESGHRCDYCNRRFTTATSMYRHRKHYCALAKGGIGAMKRALAAKPNLEKTEREQQQAEMDAMRKELKELKALMRGQVAGGGGGGEAPAVTNNNGIGPQTNNGPVDQHVEVHNHNHVVENHYHEAPRVFGDEDVSRISRGVIAEFMNRAQETGGGDALSQASALLAILIREVYSGSSAFLKNVREKKVLTLLPNRGWQAQDLGAVARKMGATAVNLAFDKQPHEDAARYDSLLKAMGANETELVTSSRGVSCEVLANNKRAVMERLGRQPRIGEEAGLMAIADAKGKERLSGAAAANVAASPALQEEDFPRGAAAAAEEAVEPAGAAAAVGREVEEKLREAAEKLRASEERARDAEAKARRAQAAMYRLVREREEREKQEALAEIERRRARYAM